MRQGHWTLKLTTVWDLHKVKSKRTVSILAVTRAGLSLGTKEGREEGEEGTREGRKEVRKRCEWEAEVSSEKKNYWPSIITL